MGHAQYGLHCGTPPLFWTWRSDDSGRLSVKTSTLHSNTYDSDSGRSSQAFPISSLEALWPSEVRNLRLQTSVRSSFYQRTLLSTRNKVGIFYHLAPSNQWTNGTCQLGVGPVPPAFCEQAARRLVWPFIHGGVPAQQSYLLHHPTNSVPAWYRKTSLYGLRTLTELLQSRDSQWIHRKNEDSNRRSEVRDPQDTGWHEKILWLTKNSGSSVQAWWQSLPWHVGHPDYAPFTETLTLTAWPLCSGTADWTYGLLLKAATPDEVTPSSVQCGEAYSSPGRSDYRPEDGGPSTAYSYRRRSRVGSRRDTQQSLAPEKIPVPHQVERIWLRTQFLGVCLQSLHSRTDSGVPSQTPRGSETHLVHGVQ